MSAFIMATVRRNQQGATYEGIIYNRFLEVDVNGLGTIQVFDPEAISEELRIGVAYNLLLQASVLTAVHRIDRLQTCCAHGEWLGTVIDTHFLPSEERFVKRVSGIENQELAMVSISQGLISLGRMSVLNYLNDGDRICWSSSRFDLLAIAAELAPRQ